MKWERPNKNSRTEQYIRAILLCSILTRTESFSSPPLSTARRIASAPADRRNRKLFLLSVNGHEMNGFHNRTVDEEPLMEVDVRYGRGTRLAYDEKLERYVEVFDVMKGFHSRSYILSTDGKPSYNMLEARSESNTGLVHRVGSWVLNSAPVEILRKAGSRMIPVLCNAFLPEGVTPSYYKFIRWRILQRFINANLHVLGTQSLLLGLGISTRNSLGVSAAMNWVLKDALGKIVRMVWAAKMGNKFDSDAKRWRYRASFLFAMGNAMEVATFAVPELFLVFATLANSFKQMAMLTSSATRNSLYNSFRQGNRENIGDITAKGEAQIAVVDLIGIASGVALSKYIGMTVKSIVWVYLFLQATEIACIHQQLRSAVFRVLNFERLVHILDRFLILHQDRNSSTTEEWMGTHALPSPENIAVTEKIFVPPTHLQRRSSAFGSLGRAKLSPDELNEIMNIFKKENYMLVVGENIKTKQKRWWRTKWWKFISKLEISGAASLERKCREAQEHCHIILHSDASNSDIVKSSLALSILRRKLSDKAEEMRKSKDSSLVSLRSRDCMDLLRESCSEADERFFLFLDMLAKEGWLPPAKFMFGRVRMRAVWPLHNSKIPVTKEVAEKTLPTQKGC